MNYKKVILVDDSVAFRQALKETLKEIGGTEVIGEAGNGSELLRILRSGKPDIIFMDIEMPFINGFEATESVLAVYPDVKVVGLSAYEKERFIQKLIDVGAVGYLLKSADNFEAIKKLINDDFGEFIFSEEINYNQPMIVPKYNMLIVDSPTDTHLQMRHTFRKSGFKVYKAGNSAEATYRMKNLPIHIVLIEEAILSRNPKIIDRVLKLNIQEHLKIYILKEYANKEEKEKKDKAEIIYTGHDNITDTVIKAFK